MTLQQRFKRNRLGELLVLNGALSPEELKLALSHSQQKGEQLGRTLVREKYVTTTTIQRTLIEQHMLRLLMAVTAIFISIGSMGFAKQARGAEVKDFTPRISLVQESFQKASYHPKLFGSTEKKSRSLKAFTKWTGMFKKFNASLNDPNAQKEIVKLRQDLSGLQGLPLNKMAVKVNNMMNAKRYVSDKANYGKTDYWATPVEFFKNGGDCEDFAIAKYTALKALGVPENRLRITILQDLQKNIPHAVLIVYTDQGPLVLDNQIKSAKIADRIKHYKPIFSINQDAWWLHTKPTTPVTQIASANQ